MAITDPEEIAARVFAKQVTQEPAAAQCDAEIQPSEDDFYGRLCDREAGHPDDDGEGGHHWI
jgi:hypothetical protein